MIVEWVFLILFVLLFLSLPVGILWQMWQDEKEMKKQGWLN